MAGNAKPRIGIVGFGKFGRFLGSFLAKEAEVLACDVRDLSKEAIGVGVRWADLDEVLQQPVIVLAVQVQKLESLLKDISLQVRPGSLVADVTSVKLVPVELMRKHLPESCDILATHPLFGRVSGANGIKGLKIATWPVRMGEGRYRDVQRFLEERLELAVVEVSPDEHDRKMAHVQALTYFIGRALGDEGIPNSELKIKTYQHLLDLRDIVNSDTSELFEAMQEFNPYAAAARKDFMRSLAAIERSLS